VVWVVWFGSGLGVVWVWFGCGLGVVCVWFGCGLGMVWVWFGVVWPKSINHALNLISKSVAVKSKPLEGLIAVRTICV
jgi:hypothetical protein